MAFGDDLFNSVLSQVVGHPASEGNLKDYSHASKLMRPNGMALAPNQKFLFHVYFNLTDESMMTSITGNDNGLIGALVKTVQLPSFTLDTEEYIQYNRKRLVHNRIKYEPVQVVLHDDASDIIRQLWHKYYTYHFNDAAYQYESGIPGDPAKGKANYHDRDIYDGNRVQQSAGWGKTITNPNGGDTKPAFFKDITIYGMSRGQYRSYTLVNPVISAWKHDQYDYSAGDGVMQHDVTIQYEAVKYGSGKVGQAGDSNVRGFATEARYDTEPGPFGAANPTVLGEGGLLDAGGSFFEDLSSRNLIGALRTARAVQGTFDGKDLAGMLSSEVTADATQQATTILTTSAKGANKFLMDSASSNNTANTPATDNIIEKDK